MILRFWWLVVFLPRDKMRTPTRPLSIANHNFNLVYFLQLLHANLPGSSNIIVALALRRIQNKTQAPTPYRQSIPPYNSRLRSTRVASSIISILSTTHDTADKVVVLEDLASLAHSSCLGGPASKCSAPSKSAEDLVDLLFRQWNSPILGRSVQEGVAELSCINLAIVVVIECGEGIQ